MKNLIFIICICFTANAKSQYVFLTEDNPKNDSYNETYYYKNVFWKDNIVYQGDNYFFISPNLKVYQINKIDNKIKELIKLPDGKRPKNLVATKQFLYFDYNLYDKVDKYSGKYDKEFIYRLNIETGKYDAVRDIENNAIDFKETSSLQRVFESPNNNAVLLQKNFGQNKSYKIALYFLSDSATNTSIAYAAFFEQITGNNILAQYDTPVYFDNNLFMNSHLYNDKNACNENIIDVYDKKEENKFFFKSSLQILDKEVFLKENFIYLEGDLYVIASRKINTNNKLDVSLYKFTNNGFTIKGVSSFDAPFDKKTMKDVVEEKPVIINKELYYPCGRELWKFNKSDSSFKRIYTKTVDNGWGNVVNDLPFAICGNYLISTDNSGYSSKDTLKTINLLNGNKVNINNFQRGYSESGREYSGNLVYTTNNCVYFLNNEYNANKKFIKYNPSSNEYTNLNFPEIKKQTFKEVKGISYKNGIFILYLNYINKKGKDVYNIFMYKAE